MCELLYHFKCEGTNKKQVDDCGIFVCKKCRAACSKCDEFQTYEGKATKEIATLKNNIYELEKVIEHLNGELTTMHQQYEEVDSDYKREKKSCRKFQEMCERARPKSRKKRYKYSVSSSPSSYSSTSSESLDETDAGLEPEAESNTIKSKNTKSTTNSESSAGKEPKSEKRKVKRNNQNQPQKREKRKF